MAIKKIPCGGFCYNDDQISFDNGIISVLSNTLPEKTLKASTSTIVSDTFTIQMITGNIEQMPSDHPLFKSEWKQFWRVLTQNDLINSSFGNWSQAGKKLFDLFSTEYFMREDGNHFIQFVFIPVLSANKYTSRFFVSIAPPQEDGATYGVEIVGSNGEYIKAIYNKTDYTYTESAYKPMRRYIGNEFDATNGKTYLNELHLKSAGGKIFNITVSDDGVLNATEV